MIDNKRVLVTLPYPPLLNHMYQKSAHGVFLSQEVKNYREQVKYIVLEMPIQDFFKTENVSVEIHVYRPAKRGDIDATQKVVFDALNGWLWVDDKQITEMHVYRHDDKENPRVELTVWEAQ